MSILISVWGEPGGWREVTYLNINESVQEKNISGLAFYKGNKIIIIVQDSILFRNKNVKPNNKIVEEVYPKFSEKLKDIKTYDELVTLIKEYVSEIVNKILSKSRNVSEKTDVEVIVVPSIGNFYGNITGKMSEIGTIDINAISGILLLELYKKLRDVSDEEIILDVTHGLNYLTNTSFYIVNILSRLLKKKLRIINFIQISQDVFKEYEIAKNPFLSLNLSEEILDFEGMKIYTEKNIIREEDINIIKGIILSTSYSTLLPLLYYLEKYDVGIISKLDYHKYAKFNRKNEEIEISYEKNFNRIFSYHHILKFIICDYLYRTLEEEIKSKIDDGFSSKTIENALNKIEHILYPISEKIIYTELNNIKRVAEKNKEKLKNKYILLGEILYPSSLIARLFNCIKKCLESKRSATTEDYQSRNRNFIAHAGFLKDITMIKIKEDYEERNINEKIIIKCDLNEVDKILTKKQRS